MLSREEVKRLYRLFDELPEGRYVWFRPGREATWFAPNFMIGRAKVSGTGQKHVVAGWQHIATHVVDSWEFWGSDCGLNIALKVPAEIDYIDDKLREHTMIAFEMLVDKGLIVIGQTH